MRRTAILLAFLASAALPSPVAAKGIRSASICGPSGCKSIADDTARHRLAHGGESALAPAGAAQYYVLRLEVGGGGHYEKVRAYYVPSARLIGFESDDARPSWTQITRSSAKRYDHAARGLRPYPARGLARLVEKPVDPAIVGVYTSADDTTRSGGGDFPWLASGIGIAGALAAAGLALARRRRPAGQ
jgi:hypothetical protein